MASVIRPQSSRQSGGSDVGGGIGAVVGTYYGGNTMAGQAIGSQVGGMLDQKNTSQPPDIGSGGRAAMQRRSESLSQYQQPAQYEQQLAAAETAAAQLPPAQQQAYMPALQAARARAAGSGGVA